MKEIPNHLIFHLKRFEFDLNTMVRSKINDSFEFPECIDMRPYTIQYLSDSDVCTASDIFQLAGVLVHNGTAESGHYYSYIKDRHDFTEQNGPSWFEFNDSEVSSFDPSVIPGQCYGGTDFIGPNKELGQTIAFQKSYSAYMLFYERVKPQNIFEKSNKPPKIPIAKDLAIDILRENERSVQRYCLFDGSYLSFNTAILRQSHMLQVDNGTPDAELVEKQALQLALKTFEQIGSRMKDCREADELFGVIQELIKSKTSDFAAGVFLKWICDHQDSYRLLLLRCFHQRYREAFASLIVAALHKIRRKNDHVAEDERLSRRYEYRGILGDVLSATLNLWDNLNSLFKPWEEYFFLLTGISNLGLREKEFLLQSMVLKSSLILFMPEYLEPEFKAMHPNVVRMIEKNPKRISCRFLLEFIESLLQLIHVGLQPCKNEDCRVLVPEVNRYPPTIFERYLLFHTTEKDTALVNIFLFKQVYYNYNICCTQKMIENFLKMDQDGFGIHDIIEPMKAALMHGIFLDPANEAGPYLEALVAYCTFVRYSVHVKEIITGVADEVATIGLNGGAEHFSFFYKLWTSRNLRLKSTSFLANRVMDTVPSWAPPLLCFPDIDVRHNTELLLKEKLFQQRSEDSRKRIIEAVIERLPEACFRFAEEKFLKNKDLCTAADEKTFDSLIRILELCPRIDIEEDPGYSTRIDGRRILAMRLTAACL